ncbi:hypothetical protein [Helicobacter rodentium]|nr:hypothetical protein [Helicobacter rodentium]
MWWQTFIGWVKFLKLSEGERISSLGLEICNRVIKIYILIQPVL